MLIKKRSKKMKKQQSTPNLPNQGRAQTFARGMCAFWGLKREKRAFYNTIFRVGGGGDVYITLHPHATAVLKMREA